MEIADYEDEILAGSKTAMISMGNNSNLAYRPEFISNNPTIGKKVLTSIEQELKNCDEFRISVAFITMSGITPLLQILKNLETKGIPGRILTTDYLSFSEPKALDKLSELKNIELKMFRTNRDNEGFHTKGYIFKKDEIYRFIIGSSNLTLSAVTTNREWNAKFVSTENGEIAKNILNEFDELWTSAKDYSEVSDDYNNEYTKQKIIREQQKAALKDGIVNFSQYTFVPNKMQVEFVNSIVQMKKIGIKKALLLSSTGTGKTYASAFAMKELNPKRLLFIVHREQIAKQAKKTYTNFFGDEKTYGLVSGNSKDFDADFVFATMQMMSKKDIMDQFDKKAFDAIVLDECHHAGANSYQKIMQYFEPEFWLGMTASPDTNSYDIYKLFDYNIAYEIRLQQALEEDLLCPFHYFGITDLLVDGEVISGDDKNLKNFAKLVSDDRVKYILEKAEYFGYSGDRVKGLIFCSRKEEAKELSDKFNRQRKKDGTLYRTAVLTGEDTQSKREEIINKLTAEDEQTAIDYIFTVDIFNEGVDIPEVNQVIMLRPTESPVVFIQQLGRGLRKFRDKEYIVILDFIGNYTNNFMIPVALSGDRSYNKDTIRKYVREGARVIPGCSTIHFDEIAEKKIYASIDNAQTNNVKLIVDSYNALKNKLGKIPSISDFKNYGSIEIEKIFNRFGSYYSFLRKREPDYKVVLSDDEECIICYLSSKLVQYKRIHEIAMLKELICNKAHAIDNYSLFIRSNYHRDVSADMENSVYNNLTNKFPLKAEQNKYKCCELINRDATGKYLLDKSFEGLLCNSDFRDMVLEILAFGEERIKERYSDTYKETCFNLYKKYTYEDVCRLLGWESNITSLNIGGYFYDKNTKTLPVFINYDKTENAIQYADRFVSDSYLVALSKHPRNVDSSDAEHIYRRKMEDKDNRIYLFVRKNKDDKEAKEFYFLGEISAEGQPTQIKMPGTNDNAFEILYKLETPVRNDIYDYIVQG